MGGTTARGFPTVAGTDRVMDGDNVITALSNQIESRLFGAASFKRVWRSTSLSVPNNTNTPVVWDASGHEGSLPCTISGATVEVAETGIYDLFVTIAWQGQSAQSAGSWGMDIYANNARVAYCRIPVTSNGSATPQLEALALAIPISAGQLVYMGAIQASGAAQSLYNGKYHSLTIRRVA